jgi:glycosyltransferase involved in cell wall biosynthesis
MVRVLVSSAAHVLSDYLLTSEGRYCYDFFEHMDKYDYQFEALSPYVRVRRPLRNVVFHQVGSIKTSPTSSIFARYTLHGEFLLRGLRRAKKLLKEKEIELVHHMLPAVFNYTFSPLALLDKDLKQSFIFGPVSAHYYKRPASEQVLLPLTSRLHKATVKKCDRMIAITNQIKELYAGIANEERICVIPFGVDTEVFKPGFSQRQRDELEILYSGSLYPLKGVDYLIRAMADVVKSGLKARLTIVGDGQQKGELIMLAGKLAISGSVVFEGFVPYSSMPQYYNRCDVFCFPTLGEPFGKAMVEAMACGKPVIASDVGGSTEIVRNGIDGILVPPASPKAIASAIQQMKNEDKRRRMGQEARTVAVKDFSWDTVSSKYHRLYSELL